MLTLEECLEQVKFWSRNPVLCNLHNCLSWAINFLGLNMQMAVGLLCLTKGILKLVYCSIFVCVKTINLISVLCWNYHSLNVTFSRNLLCGELIQEQPICLWYWRRYWLSWSLWQVLLSVFSVICLSVSVHWFSHILQEVVVVSSDTREAAWIIVGIPYGTRPSWTPFCSG